MPQKSNGAAKAAPVARKLPGDPRNVPTKLDWPAQLIARRYGLAPALAGVVAGFAFPGARP